MSDKNEKDKSRKMQLDVDDSYWNDRIGEITSAGFDGTIFLAG